MQAHNTDLTTRQTARLIFQQGGLRALFRGMSAIVASAGVCFLNPSFTCDAFWPDRELPFC